MVKIMDYLCMHTSHTHRTVPPQTSPPPSPSSAYNSPKSLYYKLLDSIMRDEDEKNHQDFGALQNILEYTLFHKSLFSLCVEIVLFSYNSQSR